MPRAQSRRGTRHLLSCWRQVAGRLRAAKHLALFLDFDGTLVPIRHRPGQVRLGEPTRRVLRRLAQHPRVTVCLVSGRRLRDLRQRVSVAGVQYLGLHGWERDGGQSLAARVQEILLEARRLVAERLADLSGIWLEDKGFTFGVHFRGAAAAAVRRARPLVRKTVEHFAPHLRLMSGKKIWEVLPRDIEGKGVAVAEVLAGIAAPVLPVYIGDDTTDEAAFVALRGGITVRVGVPRTTKARFYLRNPEEVTAFLLRLEAEIG